MIAFSEKTGCLGREIFFSGQGAKKR